MSIVELRQYIIECCNDIVFTYNNLQSGITSEVLESTPIYQAWYGDKTKEYSDVDSLILDKFFGGKSILELSNKIEFEII